MRAAKFMRGWVSADMDRNARMRRIWDTVSDIPSGRVASYGQVADIAGIPRGARQVGYALRQLPDGNGVPWHRVVQASGQIAFARDSDASREQTGRLQAEGVTVVAGRVDMQAYRWQPDLDELLWKPALAWDDE
jgi:methylated-DNA-protein-cysteine methyltransferase-like protein